MKPTPYNTGRIQIGLLYTPPQVPHHDADALRLQRALLGERPRIDWDGIAIVVATCAIAALVLTVMALMGWLA